jgi:hypothetical protein
MLISSGDSSLFNIAFLRSRLYCAMVVSFSPIWVVWVGVTTILTVGGPDGVRFFTRRKTITQRWPSASVREAQQFSMPTLN